jgi:predicted alpha/beta superfamily hydrolase
LGTLRHHAGIESRYLQTRHDLIVWLPPGYEASDSRYPVLYLQDGQNLFDPATAFGGSHWRVGETLDECIAAGRVRPMIVVGITNAGSRRMGEYTPTRSKKLRKGGKAERYAQMMVREIKPFVDREYRTLKAAAHTGIGGSSLGALVSLTTALTYSRVFGKVAVVSPSVWWDERVILHLVREYAAKATIRRATWRTHACSGTPLSRKAGRKARTSALRSSKARTTPSVPGPPASASWLSGCTRAKQTP